MILLIHISAALASLGYTTYLWIAPTPAKFKVSYGLVGLTLLSGTFLVASHPVHLVQACSSGLVYTGMIAVGIAAAHGRLARAKNR
ncbi:MAG TPA: hypothetical protein VMR98_05535 [Candidatus Polarisedimenticolaceae bacterium]|nr:hypothetical protein [Candidatus Polarisedimenticolaceae bacterium]